MSSCFNMTRTILLYYIIVQSRVLLYVTVETASFLGLCECNTLFLMYFLLYWSLQVYGQCKAAIYINKVHRVVRLYKYNCVVRPGKKMLIFSSYPTLNTHVSKN